MEAKLQSKPKYRVPSISEIEGREWNGFNVVSTFSGCGGSCLGYRMSGFRVLWANEFIPAAQEVYRLNHPTSILCKSDIRQVKASDVLTAIGMSAGEIDLLDGSPPCASFSTSGSRESGWGKEKGYSDTKQRTDDLFFEYVRLLSELQPRVFVAENVSGLVKGVAKGYFLEILGALKGCGYRVTASTLDSEWLGVPQSRKRLIFIGVRNDLETTPKFPSPLPYHYTVKEICPDIVAIKCGGRPHNWQSSNRAAPTITASGGSTSPTAYMSADWVRGADFKMRKYTISELKKLCGFPDDFKLTGTFEQQWERLGRSVPPIMMSHISATIRDEILRKLQ